MEVVERALEMGLPFRAVVGDILYGEHREFLEFDVDQHRLLPKWCEEFGIGYSTSVWDLTSAKEIADTTGLPLPTVYRLARELLDSDYLVHIREEKRFELGYKLHQLGVSLHQQIGVPREVRAEITALHEQLELAAYFAVHRGSQITVVFTADSPTCPRLRPIDFGFHEAPHATASMI